MSSQKAINILERCASDGAIHPELISDIWLALRKKNVTLKIKHFNALLKAYMGLEEKFDPQLVLEDIMNANLKPDR